MTTERHLTVKQAAEETGFSRDVIREAVNRKQIAHVRFGAGKNAVIHIRKSSLDAWIERITTQVQVEDRTPTPSAIVAKPSRVRVSDHARRSDLMKDAPKGFVPRYSVQ